MSATWDPSLYEERHSFVWEHGTALLPTLNARPGERIVDLGCGTGHLTAKIAETGADVEGVDSSPEMIEQARRNYPRLRFRVADARYFTSASPCDAVFSNAALHWIPDAAAVVHSVSAALKPGGRFVAEFGGKGNVTQVVEGVRQVLQRRGYNYINPWYFPSISEYTSLLEAKPIEVRQASLFDRLTPLQNPEAGLSEWMRMFGGPFLQDIPPDQTASVLSEIDEIAKTSLFRDGVWHVDYRRIRIVGVRTTD